MADPTGDLLGSANFAAIVPDMAVPKTILLPTDFSGRCDRPRARAIQLAREWQAQLIILHVLPDLNDAGGSVEEQENASRAEERLRDEVKAQDIQVATRLAFGDVVQEILKASAEISADLVVMGISRHDEIGDFVVGTTVERVVRHGPAPLLVVKEQPAAHYGNLLVGTDFSDSSVVALRTAFTFFPAAAITLLHAYQVRLVTLRGRDGPAGNRQAEIAFDLEAFLDRIDIPVDTRDRLEVNVDYGDVCSVAREHVQTSRTDLTVIGTHGRSGILAEVLGSTARELIACLDCDLLLVRRVS